MRAYRHARMRYITRDFLGQGFKVQFRMSDCALGMATTSRRKAKPIQVSGWPFGLGRKGFKSYLLTGRQL